MGVKRFPWAPLWSQTLQPGWAPAGAASFVRDSQSSASSWVKSGDRVELLTWQEAALHKEAWRSLMARAHERNVFLEPEFALCQAQHHPQGHGARFILIWDGAEGSPSKTLIGLAAILMPKPGNGRIARLWLTPKMTLSTPLLDRNRSLQALDLLHAYLASEHPHVDALVLPQVAVHGPVGEILRRHSEAHGLATTVFDERMRAIATRSESPNWFLKDHVSPKKRRELDRQRRRLEERGALAYTSATSPAEVRAAMEKFLALEASGWKGESRTALLCDPSSAAFARSMTRQFAQAGACRIDALEIDGKPLAMGIILGSGRTAYYWKTTYDESFARYSPGVLFTAEMTKNLIEAGGHDIIDSCAIPNHPMIDHLWPERIAIGDLCIATMRGQHGMYPLSLAREKATRALRSLSKRVYYALCNKTPS